ncbi:MAG: hypothetical protein ACI8R4_001746 [Paracoccaceae bacterium]|jgi:hypothetical protein
MTALKQYERLEATGLWRATPDDQRREVIVSIGEATLTIADGNDKALTHWSLAAVERINPGERPAIFYPDGDPGETLELADSEDAMIDAIERLRDAIDRARPRPGRLRLYSVLATMSAVLAVLVFWLPGALLRHTVSVVPEIKRQEIGQALRGRIERVSGAACTTPETTSILGDLAHRTGVRQLVVLPAGVADSLHLPGGIVLLNKALIEDHTDPAVVAGFILTERARAEVHDPLAQLLSFSGPVTSFRLLTTGELTQENLDHYAEQVIAAPRPALTDEQTLGLFAQTAIPSSPYAYARDITGETVLGLIEADPMAGRTLEPVLPDRDWVQLQNICGG